MKKYIIFSLISIFLISGVAFGAKYKVNTSGKVKNEQGQILNQNINPYNVYTTSTYNAQDNINKTHYKNINLVMDYSGSMSVWIEQAKNTMTYIISQIPKTTKVGLRVFGQSNVLSSLKAQQGTVVQTEKTEHGIKILTKVSSLGKSTGYCQATARMVPQTQANAQMLIKGMNDAQIGGSTPMVYGLSKSIYEDFATLDKVTPKKVILITDGGENCGGDACGFARQLVQQRKDINIDIILVGSNSNKLSCVTSLTNGKLYKVDNLSEFSTVLNESMKSTPSETTNQPQNQQYYEFYKD